MFDKVKLLALTAVKRFSMGTLVSTELIDMIFIFVLNSVLIPTPCLSFSLPHISLSYPKDKHLTHCWHNNWWSIKVRALGINKWLNAYGLTNEKLKSFTLTKEL